MSALLCAADDCDRRAIREREGRRWCLFHPDAQPPEPDEPRTSRSPMPPKPPASPLPPPKPGAPVVAADPARCRRKPDCPKPAHHRGACPGSSSSVRTRSVQMPVRLTPAEANTIRTRADKAGATLTDYLRARVLGDEGEPPL